MRPRGAQARALALVAAVSVGAAGCLAAGTYQPRVSHRIARVDASERHFVRDGRRFDLGLVGDVTPLVRGNALAESYARRSRHAQITGFVIYGVGLGALATGISLRVSDPHDGDRALASGILSASGIWLALASIPFLFTARRSLFDAVNVYNDGLEGPVGPDQIWTTPGQ